MRGPLDKSDIFLAKLLPYLRATILQNGLDQTAEASILTTVYDIFQKSMDLKEITFELKEYFSKYPELSPLIPNLNTINIENY